jgi:hypothetical protein
MDSATKLQPAPTFSHEKQVHETYISRIQSLLAERPHIKWSLESKGSCLTQVVYTDTLENYQITSPEDLIAQSAGLKESRQPSICIIENISTEYIEALGTKWGGLTRSSLLNMPQIRTRTNYGGRRSGIGSRQTTHRLKVVMSLMPQRIYCHSEHHLFKKIVLGTWMAYSNITTRSQALNLQHLRN